MSDGKDEKRMIALAEDVLDIARNRLLVNLRYMDTALTFHDRAVYGSSVSTDGKKLFYDCRPKHEVKRNFLKYPC